MTWLLSSADQKKLQSRQQPSNKVGTSGSDSQQRTKTIEELRADNAAIESYNKEQQRIAIVNDEKAKRAKVIADAENRVIAEMEEFDRLRAQGLSITEAELQSKQKMLDSYAYGIQEEEKLRAEISEAHYWHMKALKDRTKRVNELEQAGFNMGPSLSDTNRISSALNMESGQQPAQTSQASILPVPGGGFSPLTQSQRTEINDDIINNNMSPKQEEFDRKEQEEFDRKEQEDANELARILRAENDAQSARENAAAKKHVDNDVINAALGDVEPKDTYSDEYWRLQDEMEQDKIRQEEEELDRIAQERIEIENAKRIKIAADEALAKQEQKRALEAWLYQDEENKRIQAEEDEKERVNQENIENIRLTEEASEREKERLELERIQKEEQAEFDRQEAEEAAEFARILKAEEDAQAAKQLAVEEERARKKEKERLESIAEDARIEAARIKYNEEAVARWKAEAAEEAKRNDWVKIQKAQQKQQREETFTSVNFAQQALDKMAAMDNSSSSAYNNNSSYNNQQTSSNITNNYNNEAQSGYPSYMFANQDDD